MATIGFIGLGHMGTPMAEKLLAAGHEVLTYDLRDEAMAFLVSKGAKVATSIKQIAEQATLVFTMLQLGREVLDICLSEDGLYKNYRATNFLHIDCSTINIKFSRQLHLEAEHYGLLMLDAPVSGGVLEAAQASLIIMAGGTKQAYELAKPYLNLFSKKVFFAGGPGNGQVAKLCNSMLLSISMIAVAETFNLGKSLGLTPEKLYEICSQDRGQCWALNEYCPEPNILAKAPSSNNYAPGVAASIILKDLRLIQKAANSAGVTTALGGLSTSLYSLFVNSGYSEKDFSAIINFLRNKNTSNLNNLK